MFSQQFTQLCAEIEEKRDILHLQMKIYQDLSHPQILRTSQELDELLNLINRLKKEEHSLK